VRFYDFESGSKGKPGYRPERNLDVAAVEERWGVPPERIGDVLALMGDASDNVPGVPGIGPKTAAQLIQEYGDLETLLARAPEIKQPKRREALITYADQARLSKRLVDLDMHAPTPVPPDDLRLADPDPKRLIAFLKAMEFSTVTRRVADEYGVDPNAIEPDPTMRRGAARGPAAALPTGDRSPSTRTGRPPRATSTPSRGWTCRRWARPRPPGRRPPISRRAVPPT
jgi:DNA polymerase-1